MTNPSIQLESVLTCPVCNASTVEIMPTDACQWFFSCETCSTLLTPRAGDCCVFCSYGDVPCPPIQESRGKTHSASCCGNNSN
ncbi:MAG: GDCCVxC domain-containing (seleno)protein [Thioalkalivibrionaceae bacterium]